MAVAVILKLAEYVVPDLNVAVTLTAYGASGFSTSKSLTSVIVDLRAGAAGAGAVLPEIVLFSKTENTVCGNTDLLVPDLESLVIVYVNGGIQTLRI